MRYWKVSAAVSSMWWSPCVWVVVWALLVCLRFTDMTKALVCREHGLPETLDLTADWVLPELGDHDVRIRVCAAGLNFPDVLIIQGKYQMQPDLPFVPGGVSAGVVLGHTSPCRVVGGRRPERPSISLRGALGVVGGASWPWPHPSRHSLLIWRRPPPPVTGGLIPLVAAAVSSPSCPSPWMTPPGRA